jgi:hypothetical protein
MIQANKNYGISHAVHIRAQAVYLDGECVFSGINDMDNFLTLAYKSSGVNYPKFYKMDSLSKYGFLATEWLLKGFESKEESPFKKGIVFQNHSSSLATDRKYQDSITEIASPALFVYTLPNIVMGELAIRHHFKGENTFFITQQFDAAALADYVNLLLTEDVLSTVITGYIEWNGELPDVFLCLVEKNGATPLDAETLDRLYLMHDALHQMGS